jgi:predicted transcriptional regulator
MSLDELQNEMITISQMITAIDTGVLPETVTEAPVEDVKPQLTIKQAFKKDEVVCMECFKGGFKTLKKHLSVTHNMTPLQYRKKFGIKSTQKLAAKNFSDARREAAVARGMSDVLAKAREKRMANIEEKKAAASKTTAKVAKPVAAKKPVTPKTPTANGKK